MATGNGSLSEEARLLQRQLNRDLNCLSDENRGVRRQSLAKFTRVFFGTRQEPPPPSVSRELFQSWLLLPLLDRFSDPIERCRETAIKLVTDFCKLMNQSTGGLEPLDLTPIMDVTIPTISSRLGSHPFPEVAEHLRVMLVHLLSLFIKTPSSAKHLRRHFSDVVDVIVSAAKDKFHDTKKATSAACVDIVRSNPELVHLQLQQLVKSQIANFTHHHKAVRKSALAAVCRLMLHGSDGVEKLMNETVLPALKPRAHDRNGPVRKMFIAVVAKWLMELPDRKPYEARLVALLMSLMSDYAPEIQALALQKLDEVGAALLVADSSQDGGAGSVDADGDVAMAVDHDEGSVEAKGVEGDATGAARRTPSPDSGVPDEEWSGSSVMPDVFQGNRASIGARILVRRLLHKILPNVLLDLAQWTADARAHAAGLLVTVFAVSEDAVTEHIERVVTALVKSTSDDDPRVRECIGAAAEIVGRFVVPDAQLAVLLPQARGEVSGLGTNEHRSATLEVLSSIVSGMTSDQLKPHLVDLARTFTDPGLAEPTPPSLRLRLASAVHNLLGPGKKALQGNNDVCRMLLRALFHAKASGADEDIDALAEASFVKLADICGCEFPMALFAQFARGLAADVTPYAAAWTKSEFTRCVFDAWIRQCHVALHPALDAVLGALRTSLDPAKPADMRLAQLALVKVLLGAVDGQSGDDGEESKVTDVAMRAALDDGLRANARAVIADLLLPNMVWRVGRVAATIRKVSVYCLYTLFRRKLVHPDVLRELYDQLATPIKTCLSDEDSVTRKWSCLLMQYTYALMEGKCTQEEVSEIYHDLVKRLDDSNNEIRVRICDTLSTFVRVGPPEAYRGTPMEYTVDAMLIHIDDPDETVQAAVASALIAWGSLQPDFVLPRVAAVRARHRTPRYCDQVSAALEASKVAATST